MVAKRQEFYDVSVALSRVLFQFHFVTALAASHLVLSDCCNKLSPKIRGGAISERVHHAIFFGQHTSASHKTQIIIYENQVGGGQNPSLEAARVNGSTTNRDGNIALRQK